jgi:inner membrane transporter RhtA
LRAAATPRGTPLASSRATSPRSLASRRRAPAPALVLGAALSVQGGAALAKSLFDELGPPGVVLLRLFFGAIAVWALRPPRLRTRSRAELLVAGALGVVLACMNLSFYESLERLPLGIAVTVEFIGPLAVAVIGSRRRIDLLWVALAATGIALLAGAPGEDVSGVGIAFAALAGFFWAIYIVVGTYAGRIWHGTEALAPALALGTILVLPWGLASGGADLADPRLLAAGLGVGLLSSAVPYTLELEAMRRLPPHIFGVLLSLEPAVAAVVGLLFLDEHIHLRAVIAIVLVVVASAGAARGIRASGTAPIDA